MSLFCQNMMELSVELAAYDDTYEDLCYKFIEHFLWIAAAMNRKGPEGMWDEEDGFYYDILRLPDGSSQRLKVRSMVGLLPLCATTVVEEWQRQQVPHALERLRRILTRMLDENEFLSPYGIRALSRYHREHPYIFKVHGEEYRVQYLPAESDSGLFGGNSNWRGPVWMPVNVLIIRSLLSYYLYYGDSFRIECPTGSGRMMNLFEVGQDIARRLTRIFLRDPAGRRPVYGDTQKFQTDLHWMDLILFYEYFHGDNGAGIGASHQTGWTGLVAKLIDLFGRLDPARFLEAGKRGSFEKGQEALRGKTRASSETVGAAPATR